MRLLTADRPDSRPSRQAIRARKGLSYRLSSVSKPVGDPRFPKLDVTGSNPVVRSERAVSSRKPDRVTSGETWIAC